MTKRRKGARRKERERVDQIQEFGDPSNKDWDTPCQVCGEKPTVTGTELCGPCCFGEAETLGGNW